MKCPLAQRSIALTHILERCGRAQCVALVAILLLPQFAGAQIRQFSVVGGNVQQHANAALSLMSYSVVPDLAGSLLSINNGTTGNPGISASQFGGGSLLGDSFPAYVEGSLGYSRYDPAFIASDGQESRRMPNGTFSLYIRAYWADKAIIDGTWKPPVVAVTKSGS